jgi:hypothetical protein
LAIIASALAQSFVAASVQQRNPGALLEDRWQKSTLASHLKICDDALFKRNQSCHDYAQEISA